MFYIFDHFILSWDPPNMIFDPSESSHDVSVHLPPPAQLSPLDPTWATMHVEERPGGGRFNLQSDSTEGCLVPTTCLQLQVET